MTPNFSDSELMCKCGCGMLPQRSFIFLVQAIRNEFGKPMPVASAARCPWHNAKVSKTGESGPHTTGRAIDVAVSRADAYELIRIALAYGMTGVGVQQKGDARFIHLDNLPNEPGQPRPTIWSY